MVKRVDYDGNTTCEFGCVQLTGKYATAIMEGPGGRKGYRIYCSDAAGAVTWPDGASEITFGANTKLVDLIFAATLATTPTLTVNVGGQPVHILDTATLTAATIGRMLQQAPIPVPQGSAVRIVQS